MWLVKVWKDWSQELHLYGSTSGWKAPSSGGGHDTRAASMCAGVQETMSATGAGRLHSSGPTEEHPIILQPILSKRNTLRGRSSPISNWAGTMQARALSADTFASNSRDRTPLDRKS